MSDDRKKYSAEDIACVSLTEHVLNNPLMYWGKNNPGYQDVVDAIADQIEVLGCSSAITEKFGEWVLVGSKDDWILSGLKLGKTIRGLFEKGVGFPEKGGNSLRCEFFVYTFSESICVWRDNTLYELKSNVGEELEQEFSNRYLNMCMVAFKGNCYDSN